MKNDKKKINMKGKTFRDQRFSNSPTDASAAVLLIANAHGRTVHLQISVCPGQGV